MKKISIMNRVVSSLAARFARSNWKLSLATACLAGALAGQNVMATPYASGITNNNGNIFFTLNESGGNVTVTYEDGSTNANFNGITTGLNLTKGTNSFVLGAHTSYQIAVFKSGNGIPSQTSSDAGTYNAWNSVRGVDVNKNSKIGYLFGRTYVGNSAFGTKGKGLYALNADLTDATARAQASLAFTNVYWSTNGSSSSPWRVRVAPDNDLLVCDFATATAALWKYSPDLTSSNLVLAGIGQTAAAAAGIHGDFFGTPLMSGSLAQSNLVLWTADSGMQVPGTNIAPNLVLGPGTSRGSFSCIYRYDIGSGPLPSTGWTNPPNFAYTLGLDSIAELRTEIDLGKDGKIITGFGRGNFSNPNIQVLTNNGSAVLWDSFESGGTIDRWNGSSTPSGAVGTYAGVRVSPDGKFLASVDIGSGITVATMTNGIPDNSSIFVIPNAPNSQNARGMCWDAANNLHVTSSGQGLLRVFSLGITTTCISSNDSTATNGSFQVIQPPISATVVTSTPQASQGGGTPVPGVFTISLSTSSNSAPVTVNFTRTGTATSYGAAATNYIMNLGTDVNGVLIGTNSVTFPAGTNPVAGNWSVDVQIIPTPTPLTGPTLTAILRVLGGSTYNAGTPAVGTVSILNTGPQYLFVTPISGSTMSRAVSGDFAKFAITRWGNINAATYTVTNFTFLGTASYPLDYTAGAQNFTGTVLSDGTPGITISSGAVIITNGVGNPFPRANLYATPTNVTIVISLTNSATGTNLTASDGTAYTVSNNVITLTELDNAISTGEVVLWSNPLTNSLDSTNWTLAFSAVNHSASLTTVPVVIPNYINDSNSIAGGGTNDFNVKFGKSVSDDGIPPSPLMASNGWSSALKMTVNKANGYVAGVNLYPQGQVFRGNYALRFSMYLSIYSGAINNPSAGTTPREFAAFGFNHRGTNCNWRLAQPLPVGTGNSTTNSDGVWFAIDAGDNSTTPADFDAFVPGGLPNAGVTGDIVSDNGRNQAGVFKNPPFTTMTAAGGQPVNQWVDVSVELTRQTNCNLYINRSAVLPAFSIGTSATAYTNGTVMLGYLDPVPDVSDGSAFVYYSNIRAVELSPYITTHPTSLIVTQGAAAVFSSSAAYATSPITNTWSIAISNLAPVVSLQTNTASATNLTSTLTLNNVQVGTNYLAVFSDPAGYVTGVVASLEVVVAPTNRVVNPGSNVQFTVTFTGPAAPTLFQWKTNGVNVGNVAGKYGGTTTATITVTNAQSSDPTLYSVAVTNVAGSVTTVPATLSFIISTNALLTNLVVTPGTLSPAFSSGITSYSATNAYVNNPVTVTASSPVGTNATLQLSLNGGAFIPLTNGTASLPQTLRLSPPTNTLSVKVTAQDAVTIQTYSVNVKLQPSLTVPVLTNSYNGSALTFNWAADHIGYRLLNQTSSLTVGLGTNWFPVASSDITNKAIIPVVPFNESVFYKLVYP